MLPDWIPSLYPFLIHFPIALLVTAVVVDAAALFARRWSWGGHAATGLFLLGAVASVVAYFVGSGAFADTTVAADAVDAVAATHAQYSWYTMLFASIYAVVRLGVSVVPGIGDRITVRAIFFVLGLAAPYLVWTVGQRHAELVYRYGVGVHPVERMAAADTTAGGAVPDSLIGLSIREDGWRWVPDSPGAWKDRVEWIQGSPVDVRSYLFTPEGSGRQGLALTLDEGPILFVMPPTYDDVEFEAEINLDDFAGTVRLVHHVRGARYYDFLGLGGSTMLLARLEGTQLETFDRREVPLTGWRTVRVVSDGNAFRAFVGDRMVANGEGTLAGDGQVGMYLDGNGTVRLRSLTVTAIPDDDA